jgi:ribosomal protein S18 acetylase RimI-like enzyme
VELNPLNPKPLDAVEALPFVVRTARWSDSQALLRWLDQEPATRLYALAWIERHGVESSHPEEDFSFLLALEDLPRPPPQRPRLLGVCLLLPGRTAIPMGPRDDVHHAFGYHALRAGTALDHVLGERAAVHAFWRTYGAHKEPRLIREQSFHTLEQAPRLPTQAASPLRLAQPHDLEPFLVASAAMYREETLADPARQHPRAFRAIHERRLLEQRAWISPAHDGAVLFKAEVACACQRGVQIAGVYTAPQARNLGLARRDLNALCHLLLQRYPRATLYVNDNNAPALRLYQRLGFTRLCDYATIFIR